MGEPRIYRLLMLLRSGGAIVRADDVSNEELAQARMEDRFTFDGDGFGYVWRRASSMISGQRRRIEVPSPRVPMAPKIEEKN